MLARIAVACLGLAPLLQAQLVHKVNGPIAGNVGAFAWSPDGRRYLYGAAPEDPDTYVVTSVRVADGSAVVFEPYFPDALMLARTTGFVFTPDPELVGTRFSIVNAYSSPPVTYEVLHVFERSTALPVTTSGGVSPLFLDDGRMLYRTVSVAPFGGGATSRAWIGRWNVASTPLEISPPANLNNHVSRILPAPHAGVAVFGWVDQPFSPANAELFAVPLAGGARVPLTPPPLDHQRRSVELVHVRSSDELVIYSADETANVHELWAVPVDGSLVPRRLNPPLVPQRDVFNGTVAPDEVRLLFVSDVAASDVYELWSTEIDSGASVRLSGPMVSGGDVGRPGNPGDFWISPDSARVVYLADQAVDGVFELFSAPIDGHAPNVRLNSALPASSSVLSSVYFTPDGSVVFAVRTPSGVTLFAAPADGSGSPVALNPSFPPGGGVLEGSSGTIATTVVLAPGGRHVFFRGSQGTAGVTELYSVPIDGSAPPLKWNAPLVAGGDVLAFALRPSPGAVLYLADQDVDEHVELYLSEVPDARPPRTTSSAPTKTVRIQVPD